VAVGILVSLLKGAVQVSSRGAASLTKQTSHISCSRIDCPDDTAQARWRR